MKPRKKRRGGPIKTEDQKLYLIAAGIPKQHFDWINAKASSVDNKSLVIRRLIEAGIECFEE